jgi:hypothetical protein
MAVSGAAKLRQWVRVGNPRGVVWLPWLAVSHSTRPCSNPRSQASSTAPSAPEPIGGLFGRLMEARRAQEIAEGAKFVSV